MYDVIDDLKNLTTIDKSTLDRLMNLFNADICHCVCENMLNGETITQMNIGFGTLSIKLEDDEIYYKFIPSTQLEKQVITTIKTKSSPLIEKSEAALVNKIKDVYKELIL